MKKINALCVIGLLVLLGTFFAVKERVLFGGSSGSKGAEAARVSIESQGLEKEVTHRAKTDRSLKKSTRAFSFESNGDVLLTDCPINEVFALLAEKAELSFKPNPEIESEDYLVTGRLKAIPDADFARKKIDELTFQYGLKFRTEEKILEVLTKEQAEAYPHEQWVFALGDTLSKLGEDELSNCIRPYLTPSGSVRVDAQRRELFVTESPFRLERIKHFIAVVDK